MPPPGGDVIGRRRLDPHIHAFGELGASIEIGERYELSGRARGAHIHLDEPSVMGTENAVMAASLTPGRTMISNAASEPHVQDLCQFLVTLGASIEGIGSNVLHITGVERLGGGTHAISPEHIEVGSFIGMAAAHGRRPDDRRDRRRRPLADPAGLPAARDRGRARRRLASRAAGAGARRSRTTSAARSRRSRTGRGRSSPPT